MGSRLSRVRDWEIRLNEEIRRSLYLPFRWHDNDCCAFAARCVLAVTGRDLFEGFEYAGKFGALRRLAREGGVESLCERMLDKSSPAFARRGDIVMTNRTTIAVCIGQKALTPGASGLVLSLRSAWLNAWGVG